jgi:DNA repair exonuclease SbcCD ATPase subunit
MSQRAIIEAANEKLEKLRANDHIGAQLTLPRLIFITERAYSSQEIQSDLGMQSGPPSTSRHLSGPGSSSDEEEDRGTRIGGDARRAAEDIFTISKLEKQVERLQKQRTTVETKMQAQLQENEKLLADKQTQGEELAAAVEELKHVTRQKSALAHQLRTRIGGPPEPPQSAASGRELRDSFDK